MRLPTLALATVLALASLTACSEDSGDGGGSGDETSQSPTTDETEETEDSDGAALTQAELDVALLTTANLSEEFEVDPPDDDEEDDSSEPDLGCLFDFEETADDEADDEGEIAFSAKQEPGLPGVLHFLAVADTEDDAEQGLDEITDELDDCERVDTEDEDGTRWQLDVELDRTNWADGTDAQVNLSAVGTLGMGSLELPLTIELSVVRVANGVSITAFFDIADDIGSAHRDVTEAAAARLAAVLAGEEPPTPEPVLDGYPIGKLFGDITDDPELEV